MGGSGSDISEIKLFKGDAIRFKQLTSSQFAHNLFKFPDSTSYATCNFSQSIEVANTEEIRPGVVVQMDEEGEHYFSCSILCYPGEPGPNCHCLQGQKIKVEVKDPSL